MIITNVCPICLKVNHGTWVIVKATTRNMKICKLCHERQQNEPLTTSFYEKTKARVESERKRKNLEVLRTFDIKKDLD